MARRILLLAAIAAAVVATYQRAASFQFLNWDDGAVILDNRSLELPGAAAWAFTTTFMEHYQPLSWLVWAVIKAAYGLDAAAFHTANLVTHVMCVLLLWSVARIVIARATPGITSNRLDAAATAVALLYGLHPLRVEVVAWISALPYALALAFLLASTLAWLRRPSSVHAGRGLVPALVLYAASLAARPVALGFPIVLVVLDTWLHKQSVRVSVRKAWPFAALAAAAAVAEFAARAPGLGAAPWLYRLQSATSAPFVYLQHTLVPISLTPLDVLPLKPEGSAAIVISALLALYGVSVAAWRCRRRYPAVAAAWVSYLALLAPAVGLVPSGLQATADRYTYLPGIVVAFAVAGAGIHWGTARRRRARLFQAAVAAAVLALAVTAHAAMRPWADSVSLWNRVVLLDPVNDVALYNLGLALTADGRPDEAAARYRDVLAIDPAHADAKANLDRLEAARFEREGNDLAGRGDLARAAERYQHALLLDPQRTHAHAARGMALATLGQPAAAMPHLREALRQGENDPAVANALGVLLVQSGDTREARSVFETALAAHPSDISAAHNLARLLLTGAKTPKPDAERALRLARAVVEATGAREPRALDTLATALAANGQIAEAEATNARAAALANAAGDRELAVQIAARGRAYRSPGQ
jgi:tetratricopeptide (TPR) repeat protein